MKLSKLEKEIISALGTARAEIIKAYLADVSESKNVHIKNALKALCTLFEEDYEILMKSLNAPMQKD